MNLRRAVLAATLASLVSITLGGTQTDVPLEPADETAESAWECSLSTSTYFVQNGRDYANPTLSRIMTGCTSKRATITKQSKQGRFG